MTSKNAGFAADLAGVLETSAGNLDEEVRRPSRLAIGSLAGRSNRLSELASGSLVSKTLELIDPTRCRMWAEHNRDYALLDEARCADLIESFKAQGRQEMPAIVRRVSDDPQFDFEVICGARRHWTVSWLRSNNYADFRFLIEVRELTDEEAFRLADLENRAREDLTDLERARDYLSALGRHYQGSQKVMAQRLSVTESWLSRYLDLARLPAELMLAFPVPQDLSIKHVTLLKPLLKPVEVRQRVFAAAARLADDREGQGGLTIPDIIRRLGTAAHDAPKKSGTPSRSGKETKTFSSNGGPAILRLEKKTRTEIGLTILLKTGASQVDAEAAFHELLARYWQ